MLVGVLSPGVYMLISTQFAERVLTTFNAYGGNNTERKWQSASEPSSIIQNICLLHFYAIAIIKKWTDHHDMQCFRRPSARSPIGACRVIAVALNVRPATRTSRAHVTRAAGGDREKRLVLLWYAARIGLETALPKYGQSRKEVTDGGEIICCCIWPCFKLTKYWKIENITKNMNIFVYISKRS